MPDLWTGPCLFCAVVARTERAHIVHETTSTVAFLDQLRQPRCLGHVLVIPKTHIENIYGIGHDLGAELFAAHALIARAVKRSLRPDGIRTWSSNERAAGQEIPHFHLHVYPRTADEPFPLPRNDPEVPLPDELLAPSAERIRSAIAELETV